MLLGNCYVFKCINSWGPKDKYPIIDNEDITELYYVSLYMDPEDEQPPAQPRKTAARQARGPGTSSEAGPSSGAEQVSSPAQEAARSPAPCTGTEEPHSAGGAGGCLEVSSHGWSVEQGGVASLLGLYTEAGLHNEVGIVDTLTPLTLLS